MASESKPAPNSLEIIIFKSVTSKEKPSAPTSNTDITPNHLFYRNQNRETNWLYRRRMAENQVEHEDYSYKYNIRYKRYKEII